MPNGRRAAAHAWMLATIVALLATGAPARAASPAQQAIDGLNAQRGANGIPGGIVEVPEWSRQCELHMRYVRANGTLVHVEDPNRPSYTEAGALGGVSSVLALGGDGWDRGNNPWENAPIHLAQLLAPALTRTGASVGCMSTWRGYDRPPPPDTMVYTYPGPGRADVPSEQSTFEMPFTPIELLGLRNPTGPHLYVFPFGGSPQRIASATLAGPAGSVALRIADESTSRGSDSLNGYIPPGTAILIPLQPLAHEATYTATVAFASGLTHTWSFSVPPAANHVAVSLVSPHRNSREREITITSTAPVTEASLVDPSGARRTLTVTERDGSLIAGTIPATPGTWKVCARSGGIGTGFVAAHGCTTLSVPARWSVDVTHRGRILTVRARDYTRGRTATVRWQRGRYSCATGGRCRVRPSGSATVHVVKLGPTVRLTLPDYMALPRAAIFVRVHIAPGRAYGRRVPALDITRPLGAV